MYIHVVRVHLLQLVAVRNCPCPDWPGQLFDRLSEGAILGRERYCDDVRGGCFPAAAQNLTAIPSLNSLGGQQLFLTDRRMVVCACVRGCATALWTCSGRTPKPTRVPLPPTAHGRSHRKPLLPVATSRGSARTSSQTKDSGWRGRSCIAAATTRRLSIAKPASRILGHGTAVATQTYLLAARSGRRSHAMGRCSRPLTKIGARTTTTGMHSAVQYSTVQYSTVHSTAQRSASTAQCSTVQSSTLQHSTAQCSTVRTTGTPAC
jgi:hypothetical protein